MSHKGQSLFFSPKIVSFTLGGAIIGNIFFHSFEATLIGGLIGFLISLTT